MDDWRNGNVPVLQTGVGSSILPLSTDEGKRGSAMDAKLKLALLKAIVRDDYWKIHQIAKQVGRKY